MNTPGKPKPSRNQRHWLLVALAVALVGVLIMVFGYW
ncbi:MAG: hypothetical protein GAK31_00622 [Stenotrophomonas maltophilia]|uniref:Uncharacterized protein n=1 Tax=Stenotrophomonas maltophilia TaxID=40324 RepID=A0A7V8FJN7_STEMA|nr:MAG: hypothetical protein GAK31_00622 [Stenotrophomonas maltophilia]